MAAENRKTNNSDKSGQKPEATSTNETLPKFIKACETLHMSCHYVGLSFKKPELELNIWMVGSILFMALIYVLCFNTGWILRKDFYKFLETLLIFALNIIGTNKYWIGAAHKERYFDLFRASETIYAELDSDERNRSILMEMVVKLGFILKGMLILYASIGVTIVIFVALYALCTGQYFIAFSVFIPYVDHNAFIGYVITFMLHSLMIMFCCNGYLASDSAFVVTVVPIIGYVNSFRNEIVNFNQLLTVPKRNEKLIAEKLLRISRLHRMIVTFEMDAIVHFRGGCMVQIASQAGAVLLTIFLGYICGYMQAFCILFGLVFQITQYCALGTIVTAKNEQITENIYNIGWNSLQKSQQKMVGFMLHRAQLAKDLYVGQVAPLNMVTYVKIMKTMYSFFAMLVTLMG